MTFSSTTNLLSLARLNAILSHKEPLFDKTVASTGVWVLASEATSGSIASRPSVFCGSEGGPSLHHCRVALKAAELCGLFGTDIGIVLIIYVLRHPTVFHCKYPQGLSRIILAKRNIFVSNSGRACMIMVRPEDLNLSAHQAWPWPIPLSHNHEITYNIAVVVQLLWQGL